MTALLPKAAVKGSFYDLNLLCCDGIQGIFKGIATASCTLSQTPA